MAIKLFPDAQRISLTEDDKANPHKSAYENYTGIVFDTDKNEFKIITGKFRDKKDMYDKMTKEEKYLRRAYESKIWDWIQDNAETPVDGYLMLSTAVSKWINNNVLSKYYKKLLHDLPYLNREGRKGDPQTMGTEASFESTEEIEEDRMLNEAIMNEANYQDILKTRQEQEKKDLDMLSKHDIQVYTVNPDGSLGKPIKGMNFKDMMLYDDLYNMEWARINNMLDKKSSMNKAQKARVFNPMLMDYLTRDMHNPNSGMIYFKYNPEHPERDRDPYFNLAFVVDGKTEDPIILSKSDIGNFSANLSVNGPDWLPFGMRDGLTPEQNVTTGVQRGEYSPEVMSNLYKTRGSSIKLDAKTQKTIDKINNILRHLSSYTVDQEYNKFGGTSEDTLKARNDQIRYYSKLKNKILTDYRQDRINKGRYRNTAKANEIIDRLNSPVGHGNPLHNSNSYDVFINNISNKYVLEKALKKERQFAKENGNEQLVTDIDSLLNKDPKQYTKTEQKAAEQLVRKWNVMNALKEPEYREKRHEEIIKDLAQKTGANLELLKKAGHEVLKDKTNELLKSKPEFFNNSQGYAQPINAAVDYFDKNHNHDNEFITALNNKYAELEKEQPVTQEESTVNDGASSLMHQVDDAAKASQKLCMSMTEDNTHSELNPELFENGKLKEDIRQALLKIANDFKEGLKIPQEPSDIYFTGSEANYNYNDHSDIDLHLVYDFEQVGVPAELLNKYLMSAKNVYNTRHDITIKDIPVEVGAENITEPLTSSGIYSLISNNWVIEPKNADVEIEEPEQSTLNELRNQIEDAISEQDKDKIEGMIKTVWDMRKEGLKDEGEFGPSNTLFKMLRNEGILSRLKDAYYAAESRDLSLESIMKEEFFKGRDEIFTVEDDLINKSEQEIYDGLMDHCNGNTKEALAKLEDVMKSCDDGYKDKLQDVARKIRESASFENKCNIIVEDTLDDMYKKMYRRSHVDKSKDFVDIDETMAFLMQGINSLYKEKGMPFRYIDDKGKKHQFVLAGIEKSEEPKKVFIKSMNIAPNEYGKFVYNYGELEEMPISKLLDILDNGMNDSFKNALDDKLGMPVDDYVKFAAQRKEDIDNAYKNWYNDHKEEYELDRYPANIRHKIYDRIFHKHEPEYLVLNDYRKVDDWKDILKNKKEELSLNEAAYSKDDYYILGHDQQGKIVVQKLEDLGILPEFIRVPFADSEQNLNVQSRGKRGGVNKDLFSGGTRYHTIYGLSKETDKQGRPVKVLIRNTTPTGASTREQAVPVPLDFIFRCMYDPKNDIENVIERANEQIFDYEGAKKFNGRTWSEGTYEDLHDEEIVAALDEVERHLNNENEMYKFIHNTPGELHPKYYKHLVDIYKENPDDFRVIRALRMLDPDVAPCIRKFHTRGGVKFKIWLPYDEGSSVPPIHSKRSATEDLMKS